ncbi:MAG: efflux RND transporter periplasmic adaptor subunit [Methylophaga sp.]|jgi:RND family efflux transporter MFP subunit|uniref:efflux RND transporter periplasmic adaptor subunit n=1 Tax=Methylophaga sp. TaxID=2024840 RepID=UPI00216EBD30|nr:efflux RND transporter periplasmic adaptor subunit [Methylophaga sp.]MBL1456326.1 efflux RND transporter periplasmic adaptor subunit [Methylophaga sp.]
MTIRKLILVVSAFAFPVIAWSVIAANEPIPSKEIKSNPIEISTIHPRLYDNVDLYSIPATLEAAEAVDISARANGYIKKRYVDIGSEVKKGQLLAQLSSPELEEKIHQAKAEILKQKSLVELTRGLAQRYEKLKNTGVSVAEVDEKISDFEVAKAILTNYEAQLEQLNEEHAFTEITAPFSGIITQRLVEVGQRISANDQQPLFRLSRQNELKAVIYLPQSMLNKVDMQTVTNLSIAGHTIDIDSIKYLRQSSELSSSSGTMRMEYLISDNKLTAGMTGKIFLKRVSAVPSYVLPLNTIRMVDGTPTVQVLVDDKVIAMIVKIEAFMTNDVRVSGNLSETQNIIINPNALLDSGLTDT